MRTPNQTNLRGFSFRRLNPITRAIALVQDFAVMLATASAINIHEAAKAGDAVAVGNLGSLKSLLAHGGVVTVRDRHGATPLHWAAMGTNSAVVAALLDAGAEINARDLGKRVPLHQAALLGRESVVRLLLDRGAEATFLGAAGDTHERLARRAGFLAIAEMLRP